MRQTGSRSCRWIVCGCAAALVVCASCAWGFSIRTAGDRTINAGADLVGYQNDDSTPETIKRDGTTLQYEWADKNGDNGGVAASTNLYLGSNKIKTTDGTNITLNLNGGNMDGTRTTVAFDTTGGGSPRGSVNILNAAEIRIGQIQTTGNWSWGGAVQIGDATNRVGYVLIGGINTTDYAGGRGGDLRIYGTGPVRIGTGEGVGERVDLDVGGREGNFGGLSIEHVGAFSAGNVTGGCLTRPMSFNGDYDGTHPGSRGEFLATKITGAVAPTTIQNYSGVTVAGDAGGNAVVLDGGYDDAWFLRIANIGAGGVAVGNISATGVYRGGPVFISNVVGNVTLRNVDLRSTRGDSANTANLEVNDVGGDIAVAGVVDLRGGTAGWAARADMKLAATGPSSSIRLSILDMDKVKIATFQASGKCTVTGEVATFVTNYTGGSGVPLDPYVTMQTSLRTPAGKRIVYFPQVSSNAYLQAASYRVANLAGAAGQGGILTPYQPPGLVVAFK